MNPPTVLEWMNVMRSAGEIRRYHTVRTLRQQTVAAHTWGMVLALMAAGEAGDPLLLQAVMLHDVAELATGDVPAPAKWNSPALKLALAEVERGFEELYGLSAIYDELTAGQVMLLRWADIYELTQWSLEECKLGNTYATECLRNGLMALAKMDRPLPHRIEELNAALNKEAARYAEG